MSERHSRPPWRRGAAWSCSRASPGSASRACWRGWRRRAGAEVLSARASEYEADLPYGLWIDALGELPVSGDRHGTHGALRARLEARAPLVVCLDDVHWADPASLDALAALVHRPPAGDVLFVLAARTGQLAAALGGRADPARPAERGRGARAGRGGCRRGLRASGGNPFYLEQLVRSGGGAPRSPRRWRRSSAGCGEDARRLLDAAAVVGDPFELDLAAEVAELGDPLRRASTTSSPARSSGTAARRGASRSGTRSCATRSTRRRRAAGGSARTRARRRRWSGVAPGRSSGRTTSSRRPRRATRRRSRCCSWRRTSCSRPRPRPPRATSPPPCG